MLTVDPAKNHDERKIGMQANVFYLVISRHIVMEMKTKYSYKHFF